MAIKISQPKGSGSGDIIYYHAEVVAGENQIKVTCLDDEKDYPVVKVNRDDAPEFPKFEKGDRLECQVVYDRENEKVLAINPWKGTFEAVARDIGPKLDGEDSDPRAVEEERVGNDGKPYLTKKFHVIFRVTDKNKFDGLFYGTQPRAFFQDKFYKLPNGQTDIAGTSKSKWTNRLIELVRELKIDDDIQWPDDGNVLPILLERLEEKQQKVEITFQDGWLNTIIAVNGRKSRNEPKDADEADFERDFPEVAEETKKSAPKTKKVSKPEPDEDE